MYFIVIKKSETGLYINVNLGKVISFHYDPTLRQTLFIIPGLEEVIHTDGDVTSSVRKMIRSGGGAYGWAEAENES